MKELLTSAQAAKHLNYKPYTLKRSRVDGKLAGVDAPKHIKRGRRILYDKAALDEWIELNSEEKTTTKG